jgi:hypothetical protein
MNILEGSHQFQNLASRDTEEYIETDFLSLHHPARLLDARRRALFPSG